MLTLSVTNERRPTLEGPLMTGAEELRKMGKIVVKKHHCKDKEVNVTSPRDIRTFFENVAQYIVRKQVLPNAWYS